MGIVRSPQESIFADRVACAQGRLVVLDRREELTLPDLLDRLDRRPVRVLGVLAFPALLDSVEGQDGIVMNLGHGVIVQTPPANVAA